MGILSKVVKSIDTSGDQKKEISETLDLMVELTKAKADYYRQTIEDNLTVGQYGYILLLCDRETF